MRGATPGSSTPAPDPPGDPLEAPASDPQGDAQSGSRAAPGAWLCGGVGGVTLGGPDDGAFQVIKVIALLASFVVPYVLVLSAAIRLLFRLTQSRRDLLLALMLALPLAAGVLVAAKTRISVPEWALLAAGAATVVAGFFWLRAAARDPLRHGWIEVLAGIGVVVAWIASVDNWIAH